MDKWTDISNSRAAFEAEKNVFCTIENVEAVCSAVIDQLS